MEWSLFIWRSFRSCIRLAGLLFFKELDSKKERYDLPPAIYIFMIVWLLLGFLGVLKIFGFGSIANYAHLGGLISGLIFGMLTKLYLYKEK